MKDTLKFIEEIYKERTTVCCISVAVIILLIDYFTGKDIQFPILYIIPATMAAYRNKKADAYLLAIFLPVARIGFYFLWNETQYLYIAIVNCTIRAAALSFYVYLVDMSASQKKELEKKLKVLEGILPICASCKKIRNAEGEYEPIEKYITEHSEALFSHGICPECGKKLYPEYFGV